MFLSTKIFRETFIRKNPLNGSGGARSAFLIREFSRFRCDLLDFNSEIISRASDMSISKPNFRYRPRYTQQIARKVKMRARPTARAWSFASSRMYN